MVAEYDEFQFKRCPILSVDAKATAVLRMAADKYLEQASSRDLLNLPQKRLEALRYAAYLLATRDLTGMNNGHGNGPV